MKFIISLGMGLLVYILSAVVSLVWSTPAKVAEDAEYSSSKIFIFFLLLTVLGVFRDKYEKQIVKKFS